MSAKNRAGGRSNEGDVYYTPPDAAWATLATLPLVDLLGLGTPTPGRVLESSAGSGAFVSAVRQRCLELGHEVPPLVALDPSPGVDPETGLTLEEQVDLAGGELVVGRFEHHEVQLDERFTLTVTNPPYTLAVDHLEHAMYSSTQDGVVVFLLRLNFLGSLERYELLNGKYRPLAFYTLVPRVPFNGGTSTDATEYAVFIWRRRDLRRRIVSRHQHLCWRGNRRALARDLAEIREVDWPRLLAA